MVRNARIVIVDDEADILALLSNVLAAGIPGADIESYLHPDEVLADLRKQPADVMLTDFRLPAMDGIELIRRVRSAWPHTRFILMTAYADSGIEERAMAERGVTGYLNKIASPDEYVTAVKNALAAAPATGPTTA